MVMALTPERLVGLLNEDSKYSIPPLLAPAPAVLSKHPTLLPGEKILLQQDATCVETFNALVQGMLHLTTYRVIFSGANCQDADEESYCEDDPRSVARKGYIHQTRHKKKGGSATLIRFKQKAQSFQESLQASKSSLSMKSSGRSKSRDLTLASLDDSEIIQPSTDTDMNKNSCKLISVQPISSKKIQPPRGSVSHNIIISIPCTNIYDVCKLSKSSLKKEYAKLYLLADGIELLCKTLQTYKFCLVPKSSYDADKLTGIFLKYTKQLLQPYFSGSAMRTQFHTRNNKSASKWFAIAYREAILVPRSCDLIYSRTSQNFYDFESEFGRLGLLASDCWKIFSAPRAKYPNVNAPSKTLVPYGITDFQMEQSIAFHGDKSYPAICWRSELFNTIMIRSGAALYRRGLFESRCQADEDYLSLVCHQNKQSCTNKLIVFTEQNRNTSGLLATPQQISGQITPKEGEAFCYPHVKFVYTDKELIPDHRTVKQSSYKLQALLASNSDDKNFLSGLAETQWLSQISELLETASLIVTALSADKSSVLIGYEEGCDRTAQLSSLSQLLLDSHYRTIDGFQVLIQKEWVSFGHMFAERCISQKSIEGHGPIFLQWLDCVWQLINQFPLSFEFNEDFLKLIADHAYSCRFGTFLCNSEQQHKEEEIESKTLSLWTWINLTIIADPEKFLNNNFRTTERILIPRYHIPSLKVWESYYAKTRIEENLQEAINLAEDQANLLAEVYKGIKNRHRGLVEKNVCVQDDGQTSVSSLETSTSSITDIEPIEEMESEIKTSSLQRANRSSERSNNMRSTSESKSLDDLLLIRRQETQSKTRGRWGSTKFYVNKPTRKQVFKTALAVTEVKPEQPNNVRRSQMFDGLCEYLKSKGFNWSDEVDLEITPATCCGFLTKRGNVRKNWLCRWFKLDLRKNCLAYFEERENQSFPKGVIECGQIIKVYAEPRPEKSHKHKFYAVTNDRTFEFKAHSEKVMNIWIASLTSLQSRYVNVR